VPSDAKKKWFSDPCSQLWLNVVNSTLPLFHDAIRKAEAQEVTAVESCVILSNLKDKLNSRKEENFIRVSWGTNVFLRKRWFILKKSVFSLLLAKRKVRLTRSPVCLYVCVCPPPPPTPAINFEPIAKFL
jgi:hypothetical protein